MDVISEINAQFSQLSRVQKRIASYILEHAEDACFLSLKAFSEAVNASEVTVLNFTHRIGLKSYLDLKHELQSLLRSRATPNDKLARALTMYHSSSAYVSDCIDNEKQIVDRTFASLDSTQLQNALSLIENAEKIYIIGHDISMPVVDFMLIRMRYLGLNVEPLGFGDINHMTLEISQCSPKALFILISFPVHYYEMRAVSALLRTENRAVLALVNDSSCEVAINATQVLCCDTSDVLFYNSITSAISLVNLLCTMYASHHQNDLINTRNRIQRVADEMAVELQIIHR